MRASTAPIVQCQQYLSHVYGSPKGLSIMIMQERLFDQSLLQMAQKMYRPASHYQPCSQPHQSPADIGPLTDRLCNKEATHSKISLLTFVPNVHPIECKLPQHATMKPAMISNTVRSLPLPRMHSHHCFCGMGLWLQAGICFKLFIK